MPAHNTHPFVSGTSEPEFIRRNDGASHKAEEFAHIVERGSSNIFGAR